MAKWNNRVQKQKTGKEKLPITLGDGVAKNGTIFNLKPSEAWDSRNTSSRNYNALSVRLGSSDYASITTPNGAGVRNNEYIHVQDGTVWKYYNGSTWVTVATGLTSAPAKFLEFTTEEKKWTMLVNGTDRKAWDGTTVIDLTDAPQTSLYTIDDFRPYALSGTILRCASEVSMTNWDTIEYNLDAEKLPLVGMRGQGTAVKAFNDMVICWSEQSMHILYGNDPYDFELTDPISYGCISDRSVIEHDSYLYFLAHGRLMQFLSGKPREVSEKVKYWLDRINLAHKHKCVAGGHGKYLYLSIPFGESTVNNITLELDTNENRYNWYILDEGYTDFLNIGENYYGVTPTGSIKQLNTGSFTGSWYHITGMNFKGFNKASISSIPILLNLPADSTLKIAFNVSVNDPVWEDIFTFTTGSDIQNKLIYVPTNKLHNLDMYQLKLYGTGPCDIYYIGIDERVK